MNCETWPEPFTPCKGDWRRVFSNAVEGNWLKLWFLDGQGQYQLTTVGHQAKRAHDERRAA